MIALLLLTLPGILALGRLAHVAAGLVRVRHAGLVVAAGLVAATVLAHGTVPWPAPVATSEAALPSLHAALDEDASPQAALDEHAAPNRAEVSAMTVTPTPRPVSAPWPEEYPPKRLRPEPTPSGLAGLSPELRKLMEGSVGPIRGTLLERPFRSQTLGREMPYVVYLPPGYDAADGRYPVLYMLHGRGGQRGEWVVSGLVDAADEGMRAGSILPMIIVFPEGLVGYWTNHAGAGPRWGDYVDTDLVAHIDATYATVRAPAARAIGGLSMGGWGALHHAFCHPDVFGVVGAHSPSLRPDDGSLDFLGTGSEFAAKDPLSLARRLPPTTSLHIWVDIGQDDPWAKRAAILHSVLTEKGIAHTWNLFPGSHNWEYWRAHLPEYLRFYSRALAPQAQPGPLPFGDAPASLGVRPQ